MPQKTINTRIQLKNDTEVNWKKSVLEGEGGTKTSGTSFVPLQGELIIYSADDAHPFSRLKVGDGNTNVVSLPFIDAGTLNGDILPESDVLTYAQRSLFPSPGVTNKLYIDLETTTIYCYDDLSGYTKLSNWHYSIQRASASKIVNWAVGAPTSLNETGGILAVTTGIIPTLNYYNLDVVTNVTRSDG